MTRLSRAATSLLQVRRELFWFGIVGIVAMAVHFLVVVQLCVPFGLPPLWANVIGFLSAFPVSYWGHKKLTFQSNIASHWRAFPRFFGVACSSFAANEFLYFLLIRYSPLDYRTALLIVLVVIAAATYLLSRLWAFSADTLTP